MANRPLVVEFFEQYEESRNTFDAATIEAQYPDAFMVAGPSGVRVTQKSQLAAVLTKGKELFKRIGHTGTTLVSLTETTLDDRYTMVRAQFLWRFDTGSPVEVDVHTTFILHLGDSGPRIVFQLEHEDFQQALRDRGLLPPTA